MNSKAMSGHVCGGNVRSEDPLLCGPQNKTLTCETNELVTKLGICYEHVKSVYCALFGEYEEGPFPVPEDSLEGKIDEANRLTRCIAEYLGKVMERV